MSEFSAGWLSLREPADHKARSAGLLRAVLGTLPPDKPVGVLDLACGTGSNLRYVEAVLGSSRQGRQGPPDLRWLLVDRDAALLTHVPAAPHIQTRQLDLTDLDASLFRDRTLVTASALLDLVSDRWIRLLADRCDVNAAAVLFALTYDGRITFDPAAPEDVRVRDLVNVHQTTDKGFGPALGPAASDAAADCFSQRGFAVRRERSDWMLRPADGDLQRQLIEGWADAAASIAPAESATIGAWRATRLAHVEQGRSTIVVGHQDLAAVHPRRVHKTRVTAGPPGGSFGEDDRRSQSKSTSPPMRNTR